MTYENAIGYLDSFYNFEKKAKPKMRYYNLERIEKLVELFDYPQYKYETVHVTGTKGKGSTAAFIAGILSAAGYKVGLYTSPHLYDLRERIQINGKMIREKELASGIALFREKARSLRKDFKPSYFEVFTSIAFNHFASKNVDFAVIEVGMGGRLDATNIITPIASAITSISIDHTKELGSTVKKITYEKAGIIKQGVPVVSARQDNEAMRVIKKQAALRKSDLFVVGKDIIPKSKTCSLKGEVFSLHSVSMNIKRLKISMPGEHQIENAAIAVAVSELIRGKGFAIPLKAVTKGLMSVRMPGRIEVIKEKPLVVFDGAHNKASMCALMSTLERNMSGKNKIFILGVSRGKDIEGITRVLDNPEYRIILTMAGTERAMPLRELRKYFRNADVMASKDVGSAYKMASALAGKDDIIIVTGSFYLAGEMALNHA